MMTGSSRSSSASGLSRKRCGCGDEVVVFTAGSKAKNPGKRTLTVVVVYLNGWRMMRGL
ncbi:hypothetical protein SESBI_47420 [Sesbania bispinosa]|nr:hypothetical protein SESBI_47420 [Sesbania bispinosa]